MDSLASDTINEKQVVLLALDWLYLVIRTQCW